MKAENKFCNKLDDAIKNWSGAGNADPLLMLTYVVDVIAVPFEESERTKLEDTGFELRDVSHAVCDEDTIVKFKLG